MSRRLLSSLVLSLATAGTIVIGVAGATPASAHAKLMSSTPANGAAVGPNLRAVVLRFDDVVTLVPNAIRLTDAAGHPVATGAPQIIKGRTLRAALPSRLTGGGYRLDWRILADDGHVESGVVSFRVHAGAATAPATAVPPAPPTPGQPLWPVVAAGVLAAGAALSAGLMVYRYLRSGRLAALPAYPDEFPQPLADRSAAEADEHVVLR